MSGHLDSPIEEQARQLRLASRHAQRLEQKITDPVAIGKIAAMLKGETVCSDLPLEVDTRRIEAVETGPARVDRDILEHGREDRPPTTERQTAPRIAEG